MTQQALHAQLNSAIADLQAHLAWSMSPASADVPPRAIEVIRRRWIERVADAMAALAAEDSRSDA